MGLLGLGQEYRNERQGSFFVAESHTLYNASCRPMIP